MTKEEAKALVESVLNDGELAHALKFKHKYIDKYFKNGRWNYIYEETKNKVKNAVNKAREAINTKITKIKESKSNKNEITKIRDSYSSDIRTYDSIHRESNVHNNIRKINTELDMQTHDPYPYTRPENVREKARTWLDNLSNIDKETRTKNKKKFKDPIALEQWDTSYKIEKDMLESIIRTPQLVTTGTYEEIRSRLESLYKTELNKYNVLDTYGIYADEELLSLIINFASK